MLTTPYLASLFQQVYDGPRHFKVSHNCQFHRVTKGYQLDVRCRKNKQEKMTKTIQSREQVWMSQQSMGSVLSSPTAPLLHSVLSCTMAMLTEPFINWIE